MSPEYGLHGEQRRATAENGRGKADTGSAAGALFRIAQAFQSPLSLKGRRHRSASAPLPLSILQRSLHLLRKNTTDRPHLANNMLAAPTSTFDEDDWVAPNPAKLYRAASVGNSWGVTIMGRGFDWQKKKDEKENSDPRRDDDSLFFSEPFDLTEEFDRAKESSSPQSTDTDLHKPFTTVSIRSPKPSPVSIPNFTTEPESYSASASPGPSSSASPLFFAHTPDSTRPPLSRSPSTPRPRRRSSQQRVSTIAGRVSIVPQETPVVPSLAPQRLVRTGSARSLLSNASSTGPPTPGNERESYLGQKSITEFIIEGEVGRGAYGLVKRAREMNDDGSLGPPLIIKQVFKSRILADCWKKHPQYGTIPIEIYVMNAISSASYVLPPRRPWDPSRPAAQTSTPDNASPDPFVWEEGKVVKGHPNICPLLDFFEDDNYYYLVMPSSTPEAKPNEPSPPSDLFDLVEFYPQGLPPGAARSYLGQIADALSFLHSKGIVHRDVKDENVVLGPNGRCILIDFGSSGLIKKNGWDTFSGTLDYAGPEILRGERYHGKEQDVWAFGVVAYVLLVGECPFTTAAEAQEGLESPFANASIALEERCGDSEERDGEEQDGGGALGDAAALIKACLRVEVSARPTFERILESRFLNGDGGWGMKDSQ